MAPDLFEVLFELKLLTIFFLTRENNVFLLKEKFKNFFIRDNEEK